MINENIVLIRFWLRFVEFSMFCTFVTNKKKLIVYAFLILRKEGRNKREGRYKKEERKEGPKAKANKRKERSKEENRTKEEGSWVLNFKVL